jgi:hypothetical protein
MNTIYSQVIEVAKSYAVMVIVSPTRGLPPESITYLTFDNPASANDAARKINDAHIEGLKAFGLFKDAY